MTIEHQLTQAEQPGFKLDGVIADGGVSGLSTKRRERPQGHRLFDLLRNSDTLFVRWVDRLGRNYEDICETIRKFMRRRVAIGLLELLAAVARLSTLVRASRMIRLPLRPRWKTAALR